MRKWLEILAFSSCFIIGITLICFGTISYKEHKRNGGIETITLDDAHFVLLRGHINDALVREASVELLLKSKNLPHDSKLYLVLDTPGGDIVMGARLIEVIKGLPQKVDTISIRSYSMGFHIVQALGERLITRYGTMMEHVGSVGLPPGDTNEVFSLMTFVNKQFNVLNQTDADRMGLSFEAFMLLIANEYWTQGFQAVQEKAADRVIDIRCADELPVEKCPLIPEIKTLPFLVQ